MVRLIRRHRQPRGRQGSMPAASGGVAAHLSSSRSAAARRTGSRPTTTTSTARPAAASAAPTARRAARPMCGPRSRYRRRPARTETSVARRRAPAAACGGSSGTAPRPHLGSRDGAAATPSRSPPRPACPPSRPRSGTPRAMFEHVVERQQTPQHDLGRGGAATPDVPRRWPGRWRRAATLRMRSRDPFQGCSTACLRHRRTKRLASAGLVRPMKARYCEQRNTPLCRQTSASYSASRQVQPTRTSTSARFRRWAIIGRRSRYRRRRRLTNSPSATGGTRTGPTGRRPSRPCSGRHGPAPR